jgi:hypothetical protein
MFPMARVHVLCSNTTWDQLNQGKLVGAQGLIYGEVWRNVGVYCRQQRIWEITEELLPEAHPAYDPTLSFVEGYPPGPGVQGLYPNAEIIAG